MIAFPSTKKVTRPKKFLGTDVDAGQAVTATPSEPITDGLFPPAGFRKVHQGDARKLPFLADDSIDLIVTSPPYWRKRDYGVEGQIGQEDSPEDYVEAMMEAMTEWRRVLRPTGSIFLNIGDSYDKKSLQGIPGLFEVAARKATARWILRNRIIWVKKGGNPDPARDRLVNRHEYILHFAKNGYYYDLFGYAHDRHEKSANPGDIWEIQIERNTGKHLAPFPREIARRAILLACPEQVCSRCGKPRERIVERGIRLDPSRPQALRAMAIATEKGMTPAHFAAIRATGISDAGKAKLTQTGTNKNAEHVQRLAQEAKEALGGYFREFTFAQWEEMGWTDCGCGAGFVPGVVLDPFMGTGTTLDMAISMGRSAIGVDLAVEQAPKK